MRTLIVVVLALAWAGAAAAQGARTTYFYGPGNQPQGRLVETPDDRSATLYAPAGQVERVYRRSPNGWVVTGPGGAPLGRVVTAGTPPVAGSIRPESRHGR